MKTINGTAICLVGDVDASTPDAVPTTYFPQCSNTCCDAWASSSTPSLADKTIQAACAAETTDACFCAVKPKDPMVCKDGGTVTAVWRKGGVNTPLGKTVNFRCAGF